MPILVPPVKTSYLKTTCPRDCYDACGIHVMLRDGQIAAVRGDPDHPTNRGTLCAKCSLAYNGVWRDPSSRLATPLIRVGTKGDGHFEPASWEKALELIASKLHPLRERGEQATLLHTHYHGTCGEISMRFPQRFFNAFGGTEITPGTICDEAGHAVLRLMFGTSLDGFDPRTMRDSQCLLIWGANPSASAPHVHKHWLREFPGKVVVIDPRRTESAARAHLHLQIRPGTDAVMAFALLHALQARTAWDEAFLKRNSLGWREVAETVKRWSPARASEICGVPAEQIEQAAAFYGAGPSMLWMGIGLQRQKLGGNIVRACALLPVFTGNIGRPGTGFLYFNGGETRGVAAEFLEAPHLRQNNPEPLSHLDFASALENPRRSRALMVWNSNPVASGAEQSRLRKALAREDLFTVVVELFQTDTADYADVVLPAASFLESDDVVLPYFAQFISVQQKVAPCHADSLPNQEIFRRLARALGMPEAELYETDEILIPRLLDATGTGVSFEELKTKGSIPCSPAPRLQFADLRFATPSGRIEISSPRFSTELGLAPSPADSHDAPPPAGRLRLLSPSSDWLMCSSYGNDPKIQAKLGASTVFVSPGDSVRLGIGEGASVRLKHGPEELICQAKLSSEVADGVAIVFKSPWLKADPQRKNVNVLHHSLRADAAASTAVNSIEVLIEAVTPAF